MGKIWGEYARARLWGAPPLPPVDEYSYCEDSSMPPVGIVKPVGVAIDDLTPFSCHHCWFNPDTLKAGGPGAADAREGLFRVEGGTLQPGHLPMAVYLVAEGYRAKGPLRAHGSWEPERAVREAMLYLARKGGLLPRWLLECLGDGAEGDAYLRPAADLPALALQVAAMYPDFWLAVLGEGRNDDHEHLNRTLYHLSADLREQDEALAMLEDLKGALGMEPGRMVRALLSHPRSPDLMDALRHGAAAHPGLRERYRAARDHWARERGLLPTPGAQPAATPPAAGAGAGVYVGDDFGGGPVPIASTSPVSVALQGYDIGGRSYRRRKGRRRRGGVGSAVGLVKGLGGGDGSAGSLTVGDFVDFILKWRLGVFETATAPDGTTRGPGSEMGHRSRQEMEAAGWTFSQTQARPGSAGYARMLAMGRNNLVAAPAAQAAPRTAPAPAGPSGAEVRQQHEQARADRALQEMQALGLAPQPPAPAPSPAPHTPLRRVIPQEEVDRAHREEGAVAAEMRALRSEHARRFARFYRHGVPVDLPPVAHAVAERFGQEEAAHKLLGLGEDELIAAVRSHPALAGAGEEELRAQVRRARAQMEEFLPRWMESEVEHLNQESARSKLPPAQRQLDMERALGEYERARERLYRRSPSGALEHHAEEVYGGPDRTGGAVDHGWGGGSRAYYDTMRRLHRMGLLHTYRTQRVTGYSNHGAEGAVYTTPVLRVVNHYRGNFGPGTQVVAFHLPPEARILYPDSPEGRAAAEHYRETRLAKVKQAAKGREGGYAPVYEWALKNGYDAIAQQNELVLTPNYFRRFGVEADPQTGIYRGQEVDTSAPDLREVRRRIAQQGKGRGP